MTAKAQYSSAEKPRNRDNDALRFPFAEAPAPGRLMDVAPGIKWLRMPLPFALNHINLWVLDDGDGWTIVDTGISTYDTRRIWTEIFEEPLKGKPVKRLLCTHFHPDHIGVAGWLVETLGIPMWITPGELEAARFNMGLTRDKALPLASKLYIRAGLESIVPTMIAARGEGYRGKVADLPETVSLIDPDKDIESGGLSWRVVVGEGHSPQMAALYAAVPGILISGDQVLPGISPNVSVRDSQPDANPLKLFLESLLRFKALPADTLVLPSHKLPFYGVRERVDQLIAHHHNRLEVARQACIAGTTAGEVMMAMFKRALDPHQMSFALGETLAHLNYLIATGAVVREATLTGADLYQAV
jgi:glyoxylase-like metal-dependent hydrolase (beta-lactamase superfamily II)